MQLNGCSTSSLRSSAGKQWIITTGSNGEKAVLLEIIFKVSTYVQQQNDGC